MASRENIAWSRYTCWASCVFEPKERREGEGEGERERERERERDRHTQTETQMATARARNQASRPESNGATDLMKSPSIPLNNPHSSPIYTVPKKICH